MTFEVTSPLQVCRSCGGGAPVDVHFCPQCQKILTLGRHGDYFTFMGLPRRLGLDAADLEQRFRTLSRQFHPDYYYNADAAERRASLERSSYLNDAYRTLRNPATRIEYLLRIEGLGPQGPEQATSQVPPALLEEVFALNEELDEIRDMRASGDAAWSERLARAREPIEAKRRDQEAQLEQLSREWDDALDNAAPADERRAILTRLRDRFLERNYISNLLGGIERELANGD